MDAGQERPRDGQHDGFIEQQLVAEGHGVGVGNVYDEIQLILFQHMPEGGRGKLDGVDLAVGELLIKGGEDGGQEQVAPVGADAELEQLAASQGDVAELGVQPPEGGLGLFGPRAEQAPGVGQLQPVPAAGEQRRAQFLFQRLQAQRERRLGEIELLRRPGDVFFFRKGQDIFQLVPVHHAPPNDKKNLLFLS